MSSDDNSRARRVIADVARAQTSSMPAYGRYDLGDNAARIIGFLSELHQESWGRWVRRRLSEG